MKENHNMLFRNGKVRVFIILIDCTSQILTNEFKNSRKGTHLVNVTQNSKILPFIS